MKSQLISVIIPIYNREKYLHKCVNSVLGQKDVTTEIILIDDGSTDNSLQICNEFAKQHSNILVIHTDNHGVSHARNIGLDNANGDYIFFLDSDDSIVPDALVSLKNALEDNNADYSIGNMALFDRNGDFIDNCHLTEEYRNRIIDEKTLWQSPIKNHFPIHTMIIGMLFKSKLWDKIRFPEGITSEDSYVLLDILDQSPTIYSLDKIVYYHVFTTDSITRSGSSTNLIDSPYVNSRLVEYLIDRKYYDIALERFGQGTRTLITANEVFKDSTSKARIKDIYERYCKLSKLLSPHVSHKCRCRFILFRFSFGIYSRIQKMHSALYSQPGVFKD